MYRKDHYFSAYGDRARQFDSVVIVLDYLIMRTLGSGICPLLFSLFSHCQTKLFEPCRVYENKFSELTGGAIASGEQVVLTLKFE